MGGLSSHPVTLVLALVSMIVWSAGNRNKNKKVVCVGLGLSLIATVTFFLNI